MSETLLQVRDLKVYYPVKTQSIIPRKVYVKAVDGISFDVRRKEAFGIVGESGCGKSTTGHAIVGLLKPTSGRVLFEGKDNGAVWFQGDKIVENHPQGKMKKLYKGEEAGSYTHVLAPTPDKITQLGMARTFQNIRLWKSQTVFDNVLIAMHCRTHTNFLAASFRMNHREEQEQRERVAQLLETVGLYDVKDELATSLPYGKQRRLEIARALATDPKLLLLDEPAAGMNPQETQELTAFIGQIRSDFHMTVFLIEHHMDLVMDISDRIYVLDFGKLIAQGTPEEIQNNNRVIDAYLGVVEDA